MAPILSGWINVMPPEDQEAIAGVIAEYILKKALSGHFGFFKPGNRTEGRPGHPQGRRQRSPRRLPPHFGSRGARS